MNRREAFRTLAAGSAVGALAGGMAIMATPSIAAVDPDPSLAAIAAHKAAWAAWQASPHEDDPNADALDQAERRAWDAVVSILPTTLAGVAELSGYVGRALSIEAPPSFESIELAFVTISSAAARLAYLVGSAR